MIARIARSHRARFIFGVGLALGAAFAFLARVPNPPSVVAECLCWIVGVALAVGNAPGERVIGSRYVNTWGDE